MAMAMIESTNPSISRHQLIGEHYNQTLTQSVQTLLTETQKTQKNPNFSHFIKQFYELMQAKLDPAFESIWVYSALSFRVHNKSNQNDPFTQISLIKDLFQLISACSGSCTSSKSIALLVPVVYEVFNVFIELSKSGLEGKKEKKVVKEIKSLVEVVMGYIGICCSRDFSEESDLDLIVSFKDLMGFWVGGESDRVVESFLPLASGEVGREIGQGNIDVGYLAGVVMVEVFLLKLCLNFKLGNGGVELEQELRSWVVCSITGFKNFYFLEILVRMLLEPTLPVTSLMTSENVGLLRKILYDVVILVEFSFLNPERAIHIPADRMKSLALTRLIVTCQAIEFSRKDGDQKRAISYTTAFSNSVLCSQLMRWAINHIADEKESISKGSSPRALLKWLLSLENQGLTVFDNLTLKSYARSVLDNSRDDHQAKVEGKKVDADLFFIDKVGEREDTNGSDTDIEGNESMSAALIAAAQSLKKTKSDRRKRTEKGTSGKKKKVKYTKYDLDNSSGFSLSDQDRLSNDSEVEDPITDEDVDIPDQ
ncbi:hypothetical protein ACFE04_016349 [Oxalis oulophora]